MTTVPAEPVDAAPPAEVATADATPAGPSLKKRAMAGGLWTVFGFGGTQVVRLVSNIVLAQVLLAGDFGLMGKVNVILMGLLMFSDIGIGPALISSKRTDAAFLNTAWTIQVARGFLLWGAASALAQPLSVLLNEPMLVSVLPVVTATAAIQGLQSSNWFSANRTLAVRSMMGIEVGMVLVLTATMIFWAYGIEASVWALVAGNLAGSAFQTVMSHTLPGVKNRFHIEREAAGELIRFGRWLFVSTVITFFAMQIDKLLLVRFTTTQTFGVFYIGMQLANLAPTLALKVAHMVGFPAISEVFRERPREFRRAFLRVQAVTLVPVHAALLGMIVFGPSLFYLAYPVSYWGAGWIVQVISLNAALQLLNTSYGNAFMATGRTALNMKISLVQVVSTSASVLVGYALGGETGFLLGLAVCQHAAYPLTAAIAQGAGVWQMRFDLALVERDDAAGGARTRARAAAGAGDLRLGHRAAAGGGAVARSGRPARPARSAFADPRSGRRYPAAGGCSRRARTVTPTPPSPAASPAAVPLRITFLLKRGDFSGGVRVVRTYAEKLRDRGHRVTLVSCAEPPEPLRSRVKRALTGGGLAPRPERVPGHLDDADLEHLVLPGGRVPRAADLPDADVLVTTWWETAEWTAGWPARAAVAKGRPVDFVQHDERVFIHLTEEDKRRVVATWRLDRPKVAVAAWIRREMLAAGSPPVEVVPNAVDTGLFHARPRGKQPAPTVGFMHTRAGFKGLDVMVAAIALARETVPDLAVQAFGHADAPATDPELPAGTAYTRQPPQARIHAVYGGCDAWLFGSRCEGFGLPILEAMACRTPVIGTPAGAAPELLGPDASGQPAGVLVPPEDPAAMAEAIVRVARMREDAWRAMSDRAFAVATGYTWDDATDRFEAVLQRAAEA